MADLYLSAGENVTGVTFGGRFFGSTGNESVAYASGTAGVVVDQNVEQVRLPGATFDYSFQQQGNALLVFSGTTQVARVTLQNDANGTLLTFNNGTVEAKVNSVGLTLGGTTVSPTTPSPVVPAVIDGSGTSTGTQTFTLTEGSDTIQGNPGNLVGSNGTTNISGDDLIIAGTSVAGGLAANNLGAGDVIDGGAGFDTLRIINQAGTFIGGSDELVPNVTNVERIDVQAINGTTLNLINATGVEQVWNTNSTADVEVTEINDDVVLGFQNTDTDLSAEFDEGAITDGAIDVALINSGETSSETGATALNADGSVVLDVDVSRNDVDTVNITATGGASRLVLDVTSDSAITALNIAGAAAGSTATDGDVFVDTGGLGATLTDVTSTTTGDVTLVIEGNDEDLTVTTGAGNDRLVLSETGFDADDAVDLGAGEDTLEIRTDGGAASLNDDESDIVTGVNASEGVETLVIDAWGDDEINLDASLFTNVQNFVFNDTSGDFQDSLDDDLTVTEVSEDNTFTIATNLDGAASFTSADANGAGELNLTVLGDITEGLTAADFSEINLTVGTNNLLAADDAGFADIDLNTLTLDDDATVTITGGARSLNISGVGTTSTAVGAFNSGVTIDAAAFAGDAFITGSAGADTIIGGEGDDTLVGGENVTTLVPAGAGENSITITETQAATPGDDDTPGTPEVTTVSVGNVDAQDAGDTYTLTVNGVTLTYTAVAGDDASDVELGLLDAFNDSGDAGLEGFVANYVGGNLEITGPAGQPFAVSGTATNAPATEIVGAGVDTFTGNGGDDLFVVATSDITALNGTQAGRQADTITDFGDDDVISFAIGGFAGTTTNYSEGAVSGFGNVQGALTAANSDFAANENLLYSAQQVGADVYIFANLTDAGFNGDVGGDVLADQVVRLAGVTLADLANNGSFIVDAFGIA